MQTIHIYDEFLHDYKDVTDEIRHNKRVKLESLIFDILKQKYYTMHDEFWKTHTLQKNTNKSIVLIERRIHENLAFVIRNMAYYARDWSITIVCSDINYAYCKTIATNNANNIILLPLFEGNPNRDIARNEYNTLLKSAEFYKSLPFEHIFIVQTDSYLRKPIDESMFTYDLVAAPLSWDETSVGGGMSYRKRSSMINVCEKFLYDAEGEDCFICEGVKLMNYSIPDIYKGIEYIAESIFVEDPMGTHQWWTYYRPELGIDIFDNYLFLKTVT